LPFTFKLLANQILMSADIEKIEDTLPQSKK